MFRSRGAGARQLSRATWKHTSVFRQFNCSKMLFWHSFMRRPLKATTLIGTGRRLRQPDLSRVKENPSGTSCMFVSSSHMVSLHRTARVTSSLPHAARCNRNPFGQPRDALQLRAAPRRASATGTVLLVVLLVHQQVPGWRSAKEAGSYTVRATDHMPQSWTRCQSGAAESHAPNGFIRPRKAFLSEVNENQNALGR